LVAQYADACNLFPTPEIARKLDILRQHCKEVGRNYDDIEKTAMSGFDVGENGKNVGRVIGGLNWLAGMGIQTVIGGVPRVDLVRPRKRSSRQWPISSPPPRVLVSPSYASLGFSWAAPTGAVVGAAAAFASKIPKMLPSVSRQYAK